MAELTSSKVFGDLLVTGEITGNAATATRLATARTIGGVSFNGTANINLPGVNIAGNQSTTGNAATATRLATARTINGTSFNGTANITTSLWGTARTITIGGTGKSVNGSGNVAWTLAEIGAASNTTQVVAGTGLSGGGTLAANRTLSVNYGTAAGTAAQGNDSRINNGQTAFGWGNHASAGYVKTNTTYTAGNGLTLSGTQFSLPITVSGTGTYVSAVTQTATGLTVTLGTPPNTNTTYSEISTAEIDTGTASTSRTITARRLKYITDKLAPVSHSHVAADIPNLDAGKITTGTFAAARIPTLNQSTTGNAATATRLATARTINGVSFNGTENITIPAGMSADEWYLGTDKQQTITVVGTTHLSLTVASIFDFTLAGNVTLSVGVAAVPAGETRSIVVRIRQGATARNLTWWSGITWLAPTTPAAPGANKIKEYVLSYDGSSWLGREGASN